MSQRFRKHLGHYLFYRLIFLSSHKTNSRLKSITMKNTIFGILSLCCLLLSCNNSNHTANYRIVPLPHEITSIEAEDFHINSKTTISYSGNKELKRNAEFLAQYIKESTSLELTITEEPAENAITLKTSDYIGNNEGYNIGIDNAGITITGKTPAGVFYGIQTLRKSLPICKANAIRMPAVQINDYPRFEYRGAHLDVSRHFFTTDSIKRFIDMLAMHNINRFHWHLTDDQGWRIEIKKYPKLSTIAAERDETVIGKSRKALTINKNKSYEKTTDRNVHCNGGTAAVNGSGKGQPPVAQASRGKRDKGHAFCTQPPRDNKRRHRQRSAAKCVHHKRLRNSRGRRNCKCAAGEQHRRHI